MKVFVCVAKEEGIVHNVQTFRTEEKAQGFEREWLKEFELEEEKDREHASAWGTGIAIWECDVDP